MADSFFPEVKASISLEQFIQYVESTDTLMQLKNSIYHPDKIQAMAEQLAALGANQNLMTDKLVTELKNFWSFQTENDFKPSTILLHQGKGYTIRALIWMPESPLYPPEIFSYYEPHDHNFDFLTVGYCGTGYTTRMYEYNYDAVKGVIDEEVELTFIEETQLPQGKVMYYYSSKDVHTQYPPNELCVSLNLIIPKNQYRRQYEFEIPATAQGSCKARLIQGRIDRTAQERCLMEAAAAIGDASSLDLIREIAMNHKSPSVRATAWRSLQKYDLFNGDDLKLALMDPSRHVKATLTEVI